MHTPETARQESILLIDDSTVDLRLLIELMSSRQMRVNVAFNGQDGYHKACLKQPDLILLDLTMPVMDGFATCRMLKADARTSHIPVIFLSAASEVNRRIEGLTLGAVDYITKPFHENEVIARVEIHLDLARRKVVPELAQNQDERQANDASSQREPAFLQSATTYLLQNLRTLPSPAALAKLLGTNEKRLNQAFHEVYAMPVFAWVREERLHQARELLTSTETPIAYIAEHLGYSSAANFAKAFRERFACSPREFRSELGKNWRPAEAEEN